MQPVRLDIHGAAEIVFLNFRQKSIETLLKLATPACASPPHCGWGRREAMKTLRECKASIRPDLETLIWTRGGAFPISMLEGRLKCPRCGSRRVLLLFDLPTSPIAKRA
jgi:hypothetical protein